MWLLQIYIESESFTEKGGSLEQRRLAVMLYPTISPLPFNIGLCPPCSNSVKPHRTESGCSVVLQLQGELHWDQGHTPEARCSHYQILHPYFCLRRWETPGTWFALLCIMGLILPELCLMPLSCNGPGSVLKWGKDVIPHHYHCFHRLWGLNQAETTDNCETADWKGWAVGHKSHIFLCIHPGLCVLLWVW